MQTLAAEPDTSSESGDAGAAPTPPGRDFIADNLRALFRSAEDEPLPPELKELLERLASEENA